MFRDPATRVHTTHKVRMLAPFVLLAHIYHPNLSLTPSSVQAPGTFGYDYSKYKPGQRGGEEIPMDEFGGSEHPSDPEALAEEAAAEDEAHPDDPASPKSPTKKPLTPLKTSPSMRRAMQQPPSPAPFSSYVPVEGMTLDTSQIPQPPRVEQRIEKEEEGGCCKCVVM